MFATVWLVNKDLIDRTFDYWPNSARNRDFH